MPGQPTTSGGINTQALQPYATSIQSLINDLIVPVILAIAFLVFLWGVYKYFIQGAASDSDREEGRKFALSGIIGFVLIFSLWAIVNILMDTLNLQNNQAPCPPTFSTGTTNSSPCSNSYNGGSNGSPL